MLDLSDESGGLSAVPAFEDEDGAAEAEADLLLLDCEVVGAFLLLVVLQPPGLVLEKHRDAVGGPLVDVGRAEEDLCEVNR